MSLPIIIRLLESGVRVPRIYQPVPLSSGQTIELDTQARIHVTKVLRLRTGESLIVFNGSGEEYEAVISGIERRAISLLIGEGRQRNVESPLELVLVQGISRGERMDYTIQKAVELGVTRIVPVNTERTMVNLKGERQVRREDHWQAIVNGACEQSGRNVVPEVSPIRSLQEWLERSGTNQGPEIRLVLHHRAEISPGGLPVPEGPVIVLIGPEGGLTPDEISAAQSAGYLSLCIGPRILRTETAALAALSVLQWLWGDFKGNSNGESGTGPM